MFMMTIKKNNKRIAGLVIIVLVFSLVVPADMPAKKSKQIVCDLNCINK